MEASPLPLAGSGYVGNRIRALVPGTLRPGLTLLATDQDGSAEGLQSESFAKVGFHRSRAGT